jgi:hypothetical protein
MASTVPWIPGHQLALMRDHQLGFVMARRA